MSIVMEEAEHRYIDSAGVADEKDGLQIWIVDTNILNKPSRTADKAWSSTRDQQFTLKCQHEHEVLHKRLGLLGERPEHLKNIRRNGGNWIDLAQDWDKWRGLVNTVMNLD
jgi:hypothetical protein